MPYHCARSHCLKDWDLNDLFVVMLYYVKKIQRQNFTSSENRTQASHNLWYQVQHSPFYTNLSAVYVKTFFSMKSGREDDKSMAREWDFRWDFTGDDEWCLHIIRMLSGSVYVVCMGQQLCIKPTGFLVGAVPDFSRFVFILLSISFIGN